MDSSEFLILAALVQSAEGLTNKEIGNLTNLSGPVISEKLKILREIGIVLQNPEGRRYYIASAHQSTENISQDLDYRIKMVMQSIPFEGGHIAQIRDMDLKKRVHSAYFGYHLTNIIILTVMAMRNAVIKDLTDKNNIEKDWVFFRSLPKIGRKKIGRKTKEMIKTWEERMTEYNANIQEALINWINPYIQMLSLAYYANCQLTLLGIDKELKERFSKEYIVNTSWYKQLEAEDRELAKKDKKFARMTKELAELEKQRDEEWKSKHAKKKTPPL